MTKLTFLKSLVCLAGSYAVIGIKKPKLTERKSDDKHIIRIMLTDQILLTFPDGGIDLNCYGDMCKLIADVTFVTEKAMTDKRLYFESETLMKVSVEEYHWTKFENSIRDYLSKNPDSGSPISQFPDKVELKIS